MQLGIQLKMQNKTPKRKSSKRGKRLRVVVEDRIDLRPTQVNTTMPTRRPPRQRIRAVPSSNPMEHMCLRDYMVSLNDPWSHILPCAPYSSSRDTYKYKTFKRGSCAAGTTGYGFVAFNPYAAYDSSQLCVEATQSTSVGGVATGLQGFTNLITNTASGPTVAVITNSSSANARVRLVSAGLRVRCTGPPATLGGSVVTFRQRDNAASQNSTISIMLGDRNAGVMSPTVIIGEWAELCWAPSDDPDTDFYNNVASFPCTIGLEGPLVVAFYGVPAGTPFEYEVVANFEYVSVVTSGLTTPSYSAVESATRLAQLVNRSPDGLVGDTLNWIASNANQILVAGSSAYAAYLSAMRVLNASRPSARAILA